MSDYIQIGHSSEQCKQYQEHLFVREREAQRIWQHQLAIEYLEENNLPLSYLDQLPKSLGGNKE